MNSAGFIIIFVGSFKKTGMENLVRSFPISSFKSLKTTLKLILNPFVPGILIRTKGQRETICVPNYSWVMNYSERESGRGEEGGFVCRISEEKSPGFISSSFCSS